MKNQKRNAFEETTEIVGWLQIFLSPFIISLILATVIYVAFDSIFSIILSVLILIIGIVIGIKLANKIYNSKDGTMHFVSRVSASPELDEEDKDIKK
ncbi:hypothetical protein PQ459_03460 [Chryseobacterium sp. KACC 21268]|nr:hypothetical protein PQ459_03460 [Chryseobacterium sp. KACC 21268]